jgi:hypothetical protein
METKCDRKWKGHQNWNLKFFWKGKVGWKDDETMMEGLDMPVLRETELRFFCLALVIELNIERKRSKIINYLLQAPGIISNETVHQIQPGSRISVAQVRNALITTGLWEEIKALAVAEDFPYRPRNQEDEIRVDRNVQMQHARPEEQREARAAAPQPLEENQRPRATKRRQTPVIRTRERNADEDGEEVQTPEQNDARQITDRRLELLIAATEDIEHEQGQHPDAPQQRKSGRRQQLQRERLIPPERPRRSRGWLELNARKDGFEGIEVRRAVTHGGRGGLGVFVKPGWILDTGTIIPYFGRWIPQTEIDEAQSAYLVGPYEDHMYVDGNPARLATEIHGAESELWAGPRVNQANDPTERNCMIRAVGAHARVRFREAYEKEASQTLRCAIEITRPIREGMELLTNYGWSMAEQRANQCGYDFIAELTGRPRQGTGLIQDEDIIASSSREH